MSPILVFGVIAAYFGLLLLISYLTSKKSNSASFFTANRKSPWYLVAFGMIGASLSGVTFISVPGWVASTGFSYFQMVIGYLLGYFVIANVLMPIYYKHNLVSIYSYLETRLGLWSYKTGSFFFLLSRIIGASFRLFLVAMVLQIAFFNSFNIPFYLTVLSTIILIYIYTFKAGIKTIVWTDTLQTLFMLLSVIVSIIVISRHMNISFGDLFTTIKEHPYSQVFYFDWKSDLNFFKRFLAGASIAIVMTGLDQDMMQKNLTCKNLKEAKRNMFWFSITLLPVNLLFLSLGVLLFIYIEPARELLFSIFSQPIPDMIDAVLSNKDALLQYEPIFAIDKSDKLFPILSLNYFGIFVGITFLIGIIAAAFSSADSALTALTTAFCVDFLRIDPNNNSKAIKRKRWIVHIAISLIVYIVIVIFKGIGESVIKAVFDAATYTYGPLLGMFAFALATKRKLKKEYLVPFIAIASPIISYIININSQELFNGYKFGFELLILNGFITFAGLFMISKRKI